MKVRGSQLDLGDVVKLSDNPYSYATVKEIHAEVITLFRPYVRAANFRYIGGVICYIGIEEFGVSMDGEFDRIEEGRVEK